MHAYISIREDPHSVSLTKQQKIIPSRHPAHDLHEQIRFFLLTFGFSSGIPDRYQKHMHITFSVLVYINHSALNQLHKAKKGKERWPAARARQQCRCWRGGLRCTSMAAPVAPWIGGRQRTRRSRTSSCSICGSSTLSHVRLLTLHYIQCLIFTLAQPCSCLCDAKKSI